MEQKVYKEIKTKHTEIGDLRILKEDMNKFLRMYQSAQKGSKGQFTRSIAQNDQISKIKKYILCTWKNILFYIKMVELPMKVLH